MKYLKYAIGGLAILFVIFLLLGVFKPTVEYDSEIIVDKPLAESWAVTQDEEKLSEWLSEFQRTEPVSGTPGTVGAVLDVYFGEEGQEMKIRETITEIIPNQSISMTYESDFMNMDYQMTMTPINGKTKINSTTTASGNGIFSKSMMAMMAGSIKKQEDTNLVNLKKTIEANSKDYFPTEVESMPDTEKNKSSIKN